ncbi:MAG TPA: hypothetical protein VE592_09985 [Geminicoccaceae bacterium]|jgi:hypothetical protein|nr:hypothetical protein [Geminicoccaceae bacterium]
MSFAFVQGGLMAAGMAVSAGSSGPGGCDGCGGDDGDSEVGTCLSVCGSAAQGLLPGEPVAPPPTLRTGFHVAPSVFNGRINPPDHGPPKILTADA